MKPIKINPLQKDVLVAQAGTGKPRKVETSPTIKKELISFLEDYHSQIINNSLEEKAEEKLTGAFFSKFSFNENFAFKLIYQAIVLNGVWTEVLGNFINCLKELSYIKAVQISEMDINNKVK